MPCSLFVRHISQRHPHKPFAWSWGVSTPPKKHNIVASNLALLQMPAKESIPKKYSGTFCFFTDLKYHSSRGTGIVCTSWSSSPNWTMKAGRLMKNNALPLNATFSSFKIGRKEGRTWRLSTKPVLYHKLSINKENTKRIPDSLLNNNINNEIKYQLFSSENNPALQFKVGVKMSVFISKKMSSTTKTFNHWDIKSVTFATRVTQASNQSE